MACRPAPADRPVGRKGSVEAEIREEIRAPLPALGALGSGARGHADGGRRARPWRSSAATARSSTLGASRSTSIPSCPSPELRLRRPWHSRSTHRPLETFDARTRFALWWVRLYGRQPQRKVRAPVAGLASSLDIERVRDLVPGEKTASPSDIGKVRGEDHARLGRDRRRTRAGGRVRAGALSRWGRFSRLSRSSWNFGDGGPGVIVTQ